MGHLHGDRLITVNRDHGIGGGTWRISKGPGVKQGPCGTGVSSCLIKEEESINLSHIYYITVRFFSSCIPQGERRCSTLEANMVEIKNLCMLLK